MLMITPSFCQINKAAVVLIGWGDLGRKRSGRFMDSGAFHLETLEKPKAGASVLIKEHK